MSEREGLVSKPNVLWLMYFGKRVEGCIWFRLYRERALGLYWFGGNRHVRGLEKSGICTVLRMARGKVIRA